MHTYILFVDIVANTENVGFYSFNATAIWKLLAKSSGQTVELWNFSSRDYM